MAYYANIAVRSISRPVGEEDEGDVYFPTVHVKAQHINPEEDAETAAPENEPKRKRGTVDYCYALFDGLPPSSPSPSPHESEPQAASSSPPHKIYSTYAELSGESAPVGTDSYEVSDDDEDDEDDEDRDDGYYVPNTSGMVHDDQPAGYVAAPYSPSLRGRLNPENHDDYDDDAESNAYTKDQAYTKAEPSSKTTADGDMEWTVLEPAQQKQQPGGYDDPEVYRILAQVDAERVKAAVRNYAESLGSQEGEALLRHILAHVKAIDLAADADVDTVAGSGVDSAQKKAVAARPKISIGGGGVYAGAHELPELAKLPLSYGSKVFNAPAQPKAQARPQYVSLSGQGAKCVSSNPLTRPGGAGLRGSGECPVGDIGRRDKASLVSQAAPVVEKNTKWNESYQDLLAGGLQAMPLASVKKLLRLANDFVYTCLTYTKVIVNELNMPNDRKTIKPATDIGGLAGGEKYVIQGILFKFCLDPQVSTKGKGVWLYGGNRPSEEKAAKAAALELQGLSLLSSLFLPGIHIPLMALIDFKGFRILATSLLPLGPDTIVYGSHDAGKTVHASDPVFNKMMDEIGVMLNLKKHTVGKKKVPIVGPGDIEGHKALDGRYYLLDYARLMPSQAPIPSEDGKWDGRGVFYQMLRPEFVRSYSTPLSSDVFTGWSMYDTEREKSEREVIAATQVMINERIPALAADLDAFDTSVLSEIYARRVSEELDPIRIIQFLNLVNLESRMHCAGINCRHMGRLRQLVHNKAMRSYILCAAVSRALKHKLRNRMRRAVREKRQGDLASEVSCKRVAARVLNKILGQHPKSEDFWRRSVVKSLRKRFPFILSPEELAETYDIRTDICLRVILAILMTQNMMRLTSDASNAIFRDLTTVKLVSNDIEVIWSNIKFSPLINILDAEVCRRMSTGKGKNRGLGLRLLESARAKLKTAIEALPSCSYSHWSIARVEKEIVRHPEYEPVAEQIFNSIYKHLRLSHEMEKTKGLLLTWAQVLEMHAERLEQANGGVPTARTTEMRAEAAAKRAMAVEVPRHHCDSGGEEDEDCAVCL